MDNIATTLLLLFGVAELAIGLTHIGLPKVLQWKSDLASTSEMTKAVSYVHTFFVGLVATAFGLLDILYRHTLTTETSLGRAVLVMFTVFWLCRVIAQATIFRPITLRLPHGALLQILALLGWSSVAGAHAFALVANLNY
jgi:hypothetical protein